MKFLKQATCIRYVLGEVLKFVQNNTLTPNDSFFSRIPRKFFIEVFDKKFSFVILHKLTKFNYQTVFTSQFIQQKVLRVSCETFDDVMTFEYFKS